MAYEYYRQLVSSSINESFYAALISSLSGFWWLSRALLSLPYPNAMDAKSNEILKEMMKGEMDVPDHRTVHFEHDY